MSDMPAAAPMAREKRILVVEDDDAIRALLMTVLRRRGMKADCCSNGATALERLSQCVYSIILLDLMMPVMTGYEVLERMQAMKLANRPMAIVLTAGGAPKNLPPDLVAGMIRKPFDVTLLLDTVSACLAAQNDPEQSDNCPVADSEGDSFERRNEPN